MKNRKRNNNAGLIVLCVCLGSVLVILLAGTIWAEVLLGSIGELNPNSALSQEQIDAYLRETDPMEGFTGEILSGHEVTIPNTPAKPIHKAEHIINILLVGQDRRSGSANGRSDAMILCTVDTEKNTLVMTSFMRDMWVRIPGKFNERLNVAYMLGGFTLLNETLQENFGVIVDHNIEVDFKAFEKTVDILGGVAVELTAAEAEYLNRRGNWDVDNSTANTWQLKAGMNLLEGDQALAYSRIRAVGSDGDFGRTGRQRRVLEALLQKGKKMTVTQIISTANTVIPLLATDMETSQILSYISRFAPMLPKLKVVNQRIPADGAYTPVMIDGKAVLRVDFAASQQLLHETIGSK